MKQKRYILLMIPVLLVEIFLFNLNAIRSMGYEQLDLTSQFRVSADALYDVSRDDYVVQSDTVELYASDLNCEIDNLYVDIDFSDPLVNVSPCISDEGNGTPYHMASQMLLGGYADSKYYTIHPYGNVKTMKLTFQVEPNTVFQIKGIYANAQKPLHIRPKRVIVLYLLLAFIFAMGKGSAVHKYMFCKSDKKQMILGGLLCVLALGMVTCIWKSNVHTWDSMNFPEYHTLTRALTEGHFYLNEEVDPKLLQMENPYDYSAREEQQVSYLWDRAFYQGKYYCYYGITPVLLVYLPHHLLTGGFMLNSQVILIFSLLLVAGSFYLVRQLMIRFFPEVPFVYWPLFSLLIGFSECFVYLYMRPDFYTVPIITAVALAVWGLALWLKGLNSQTGRGKMLCYFLGSLSMALVSGARPQVLILSFLGIALFWEEVFQKRELFSKKGILNTGALCVPFVVIGAFMMFYNYSRFGSVFDFGANYNLTTNDMTRRGFNLDRLGSGVLSLLVLPPVYKGTFPYIQETIISSRYMGKLIIEFVVGGIFATNLISWLCVGSFWMKDLLKKRKVWNLLVMSLLMAFILGCADATIAGILQRYKADIALAVLLPSCLVAGVALQHTVKKRNTSYQLLSSFITIAVVFMVVFDFFLLFVASGDYNIHNANQELYYAINSYFVL